MKIIGIDPGTGRLGFGVISIDTNKVRLIDAGVITTPVHTNHADRLVDIYDSLRQIITLSRPSVMSIEKLFFAQNITTAMTVSEARGVAILAGKKANLEIYEYSPLQVKQTLTGYGRADKKQIQEMVRLHLNIQKMPQPDDCADALAIAITHFMMTRV